MISAVLGTWSRNRGESQNRRDLQNVGLGRRPTSAHMVRELGIDEGKSTCSLSCGSKSGFGGNRTGNGNSILDSSHLRDLKVQ